MAKKEKPECEVEDVAYSNKAVGLTWDQSVLNMFL